MQSLKKYKKKDLCKVLEITRPTLDTRLNEPYTFKIGEIEKLVSWGVDRDELMNDIFGGVK